MENCENATTAKSACTSIIAGRKQTDDGSMISARSEDLNAMLAKCFEIYEDTDNGPAEFVARDSAFRCQLPPGRLGYKALAPYHLPGHWGSAGFNSAGVGMSSTETIFSSDAALKADPLVGNGLAENSIFNVVLPYIHSAREGVERLGTMIEKYGSAEGYGISFIDSGEQWYLETAAGHRWLACRIPEDMYFVTGNQSRFRKYNPDDKENFLASHDLVEFAAKNGLYDPEKGEFDFHEAYSHDGGGDVTYDYPRVWGLQKMFTPSLKQDIGKNTFPVFAKADRPISLAMVRKAFRYHYDGTDHDPYLHNNPKEPYRPVSIFRTTQTHILQVRPWLPKEIGCINHVAEGMADLGVFLPLYQGVKSFPQPYCESKGTSDNSSAYWRFRKVQTLGMVNYNAYAPTIKETYAKLEAENDERCKEFEAEYMRTVNAQPWHAGDLLQKFSDSILNHALEVTDALVEELFTKLVGDIQKEYLFHGA